MAIGCNLIADCTLNFCDIAGQNHHPLFLAQID